MHWRVEVQFNDVHYKKCIVFMVETQNVVTKKNFLTCFCRFLQPNLFFHWPFGFSNVHYIRSEKPSTSIFFIKIVLIWPFNVLIKTDRKRMLLLSNCYMTVSGHFFAMCMLFFHKTEVQTYILICSAGLNFNWFKSYGLKCSLRQCATLANLQKSSNL